MKHIFITGCPRSGTTMLGSILSNNDSVIVTPESHFFNEFVFSHLSKPTSIVKKAKMLDYYNNHYRFKQWGINSAHIDNLPEQVMLSSYSIVIEETVKQYAEEHFNNKNFSTRIDHTPSNIKDFRLLNLLFPKSKFVYIVRDPRAIYASIKSLDWGPNSAMKLSQLWIEYVAAYFALNNLDSDRVYLVKYEELLQNPADTLKSLCDFLQLKYTENMFSDNTSFKLPKSTLSQHALVGKSLDKTRINKWKHELKKRDIEIIESYCGSSLNSFGYINFIKNYYSLTREDKIKSYAKEVYRYIPNKFRKKNREK
ncbi:sulfotransferase family protein [Psychroflexus sp. ALD_RP9]|uniref:sulfotransferase family protein n=1 Tax=Psychroflexus sp. ALD_RP9 TaxID=2777186 RepID=UPI001A8CD87F|nr:sulfotransferase [Psychroflexus sp. ALD_RP9]QSS98169.1 sulfotransferase [Psychroflexus sp. ALD_RP9]